MKNQKKIQYFWKILRILIFSLFIANFSANCGLSAADTLSSSSKCLRFFSRQNNIFFSHIFLLKIHLKICIYEDKLYSSKYGIFKQFLLGCFSSLQNLKQILQMKKICQKKLTTEFYDHNKNPNFTGR